MNHAFSHPFAIATLLFVATVSGCGETSPAPARPAPRADAAEKQQLIEAIAKAERESKSAEIPESVIDLTAPAEWSASAPRPLPPDDHGFTVAYHHQSGIAVTLYQFTRGLKHIPNDVTAVVVQEEMTGAKEGIQELVRLGRWQAARELTSKTITLGDSQQQALWSRFELTVDGMTIFSDIYVWAHGNAILKLRCTSRTGSVESDDVAMKPLLTALGAASMLAK